MQNKQTYNESVALLLAAGWVRDNNFSEAYYIKMDSHGRKHQVQIDRIRQHLVTCHRVMYTQPWHVCGMIGDFVGGKGPNKAVNAKAFAKPGYIDKIVTYVDKINAAKTS